MNHALSRDGSTAAISAARSATVTIYNATMPSDTAEPAMKWDGEWQVTIEVFRDLGLAFAAVLHPDLHADGRLVQKLPHAARRDDGHSVFPHRHPAGAWALGAFFTATSMIGFMAGAGIVVRNSIILVDFIELRLGHGRSLHDACIESGAVRFRPMMLTAFAVVVGGMVILADPIFQGSGDLAAVRRDCLAAHQPARRAAHLLHDPRPPT